MDIWVRSKDKRGITKVNDIYIREQKYDKVINHIGHTAVCYLLIATKYDNIEFILGAFANKEDALQVINEFQDHVCRLEQEYLLIVALAGSFKKCPHYEVFQIPEDKHV